MAENEKQSTEPAGSETKPAGSSEAASELKKKGTAEEAPEKPTVPQYRSIVLGTFGSSKHLRIELTDQKKPERNEIEVEVESW